MQIHTHSHEKANDRENEII